MTLCYFITQHTLFESDIRILIDSKKLIIKNIKFIQTVFEFNCFPLNSQVEIMGYFPLRWLMN